MSDQEDDGYYLADTPPESPVELLPELPLYYPAIQGCRNVEEFHCLNRIEEGAYGVVYTLVVTQQEILVEYLLGNTHHPPGHSCVQILFHFLTRIGHQIWTLTFLQKI
jgi:hypothetical protein